MSWKSETQQEKPAHNTVHVEEPNPQKAAEVKGQVFPRPINVLECIKGKDGEETDDKVRRYVSQRDHLWGAGLDPGTQLTIFSFHFLFTRSPFFHLQVTKLLITLFINYLLYIVYTLYCIYITLYFLKKCVLVHLRERVSSTHGVTLCLSSLLL